MATAIFTHVKMPDFYEKSNPYEGDPDLGKQDQL